MHPTSGVRCGLPRWPRHSRGCSPWIETQSLHTGKPRERHHLKDMFCCVNKMVPSLWFILFLWLLLTCWNIYGYIYYWQTFWKFTLLLQIFSRPLTECQDQKWNQRFKFQTWSLKAAFWRANITVPVISNSLSAKVLFPWSMWATMQKFLILSTGNLDRSTVSLKTKGKQSANCMRGCTWVLAHSRWCIQVPVGYLVLCVYPPDAAG